MLVQVSSKQQVVDDLWRGATTVAEKTGAWHCKCDFCNNFTLAAFCKVYHTVNKVASFTKFLSDDIYLITDHIYICSSCRCLISPSWVSCNCKKCLKNRDREDICQVNK